MTSEQIIKELEQIIPMLEADGFTQAEIDEYIDGFITFNKLR